MTRTADVVGAPRNPAVLFVVAGLLLFAPLASGQGWYNGSWQYRKAITVNTGQVPSTQTNFPMLVSLASDSNLAAHALANGYDIVFTDSSGTNPLPYERELYNSSTGQLIAWVNVASLSNGAAIYMYYGNSGETSDQQSKTGTWNTNYVMVQHFGNGTLSANDSTSNGLTGTITGATAASGIIGGAGSYNGTTGTYIDYGAGNAIDTAIGDTTGGWTISTWFYANGNADQGSLFGDGDSANDARSIEIDSGAGVGVSLIDGEEEVICSSGATLSTGWHHVVWTYNNGANIEYLDGTSVCTDSFSFFSAGYSGHNYSSIPTNVSTYGQPFNGAIDETRVANTNLPAGWITAEYNNQSLPSGFYSVGSQQSNGGGTVSITVTSAPTGLTVTVDGTNCTTPCAAVQWTPGSNHTIAAATQSGGTGKQYVFASWSDGGAASHSVTGPSSATTYTATFTTQYYLTTAASPSGEGSISPASEWVNAGGVVSVSATANGGDTFTGFSGALSGTTTPQNLTMNAAATVTAGFAGTVSITVTSAPTGLTVTVDGTNCTTPCAAVQWTPGSNHTIAAANQGGTSTQHAFASWSDGGAASHSVTAPSSATTYTATFTTQYYLTTVASPAGRGTVSPASGWVNAGSVTVTATANGGYQFMGFSGALSGTTSPQTLIMNAAATVIASFNAPPGANNTTSYSYDLLNHLTGVSMTRGGVTQTRSFVYSGNMLMSATNPENGTVSYTYNTGLTGNYKVATRTDQKGQEVVYSYDSYARLIKVQRYPQGPSGAEDLCQQEDYYYDGTNPVGSSYPTDALGHLSAVQYWGGNNPNAGNPCDTTFTELYNYGQPGAPVGKQLQISRAGVSQTITLTAGFTYDTEGRMTGETYPSDYVGNTANLGYTFDSMGRLNTMTDKIANAAIIQGATYGPANELLTITGGNYINAWAGETRYYNSLKQLTGILAYNSPGPVSISYNYPATGNNGKIVSQTDNVSGETVTYAYDALNRLAAAATQADISASWGQSFSYDGFGNLTNVNVTLGAAPTLLASYDPGTNHPNAAGLNVDANGNPGYIPVPADGGTNFVALYDVENRLVSVAGTLYSYAPGNKRVWRGNATRSLDVVTFWSVSGQKLAEYSLNSSSFYATQTGTNYYFGSMLIKNGNSPTNWVYSDRLGSVGKFFPYGVERPSATTNGTEKFTGYFRDSETGNDYAVNRYQSPGIGRFLTPDPSMANVDYANPGSWNAYAYVNGDPINSTDPAGLDVVTLPPITQGVNCSTAFINYAAQFGESIYDLFNSDPQGILALMSFFEQEGSGSSADQHVWADLDWTMINRWELPISADLWFYGSAQNIPPTLNATIMQGSQVFSNGQLKSGFQTQLVSILTGSPNSSACAGLADAFDVSETVLIGSGQVANPGFNLAVDPDAFALTDTVPGALQFGSNGTVPSHGPNVVQAPVATVQDGVNSWTFYSDVYNPPPPPPVRRPAPRPRPRRGPQPQL